MTDLPPIPPPIQKHLWYPGHLAWRREQGETPRHDPGDAVPMRAILNSADLSDADLSGADLSGAFLISADLSGADLTGAILSGADLSGAILNSAFLIGAILSGAILSGADLSGAFLISADLSGAILTRSNLDGCDLRRAIGIRAAGPVGSWGRMIYGVAHEGGVMVQAGCHWGTLAETIEAVEQRYADGTGREHMRPDYLAALAWVGGVQETT